jgi:7,8-dihydroneopterin aldolase/epimerase/oxygenase
MQPASTLRPFTAKMTPLYSLDDHIAAALDDVTVDVRCGIHPWEYHPERPNRLSISVRLYARLSTSRSEEMRFINYDHVRDYIRGLAVQDHIKLLETIVDGITEKCFEDRLVEACFITIRKLNIFSEAGGAGIDVFRTRSGWNNGS